MRRNLIVKPLRRDEVVHAIPFLEMQTYVTYKARGWLVHSLCIQEQVMSLDDECSANTPVTCLQCLGHRDMP